MPSNENANTETGDQGPTASQAPTTEGEGQDPKATPTQGAQPKGATAKATHANGEGCPPGEHTWKTRVATEAHVIATQGNSKCTTCGATRRVSQ